MEMSKKLGGAGKHTAAELVTRLIHLFTHDCADKTATAAEDSGAFDWHVCGSHVAKHFAEAPSASFMNGPMDAQVKLRAAHQRRRAEPLGPVTTADKVDDTNAEQQTDHAMKRMVRVMKERKHKKETLTMEEQAEKMFQTIAEQQQDMLAEFFSKVDATMSDLNEDLKKIKSQVECVEQKTEAIQSSASSKKKPPGNR